MNELLAKYQILTIEHLKNQGMSHEEACEIVFGNRNDDDSLVEMFLLIFVLGCLIIELVCVFHFMVR